MTRQSRPDHQRIRELASDRRAGEWARNKARRKQYAFLRRQWRVMSLFLTSAVALGMLLVLILPTFLAGFLLGALLVGATGTCWFCAVQATGTAPTMAGDSAEQWTAQELRRLRRRGWRLVNRVMLKVQDIDHVLIGPGGAFAIETKWTATPWRLDPPDERVLKATEQARGNARDLSRWHLFRRLGVPVEPVVFLWGAGLRDLPCDQQVRVLDGVTVVAGAHAKVWRERLPADGLSCDQIDGAWSALEVQALVRDGREPLDTPRSMFDILLWAATVAGSFLAGLLVSSQLFVLGLLTVGLPGSILLLAIAALSRRSGHLRTPAAAFAVGVLTSLIVLGAILLREVTRSVL